MIRLEFSNPTMKMKIYNLRTKLRSEEVKINENLPQKTATLFKETSAFTKNTKCARAPTMNGKILLKMSHHVPQGKFQVEVTYVYLFFIY